MFLKCSEIHICSSSCCQACFPLAINQTNEENAANVAEDFLEFSRIDLDAHVLNDEEDTSLSSILQNRRKNISLVQHQSKFSSQWELGLGKCRQVLFFVVLLQPLNGMQNLSHPILTHILRTELLEFLHHKLVWSWEILIQGVRIISVQKPNSDLNSMLTMQMTGCNF